MAFFYPKLRTLLYTIELAVYSKNHPDNPIKGRILTTNYLNFTQPSALRELMQFPNIVNAGEKFPNFAGLKFPLLNKKIY